MFSIPPIPDWQSLHPAIVHFPIALLLVAPLFLLIGIIRGTERGRPYLIAALLLMLFGTAGAWLAVATGNAASELVERNGQLQAVVEQHEDLAEKSRDAFTVLTVLFAAFLFGPRLLQRSLTPAALILLPIVFLVVYAGAALLLANTAHQGGKLVHELGSSAGTVVSLDVEE